MKKNVRILSALGLLTVCGVAAADDAPAAAPAAPLSPLGALLDATGITATGYVSASAYHLSTDGGLLHQFDTNHSTFALDEAAFTLAMQPKEGFGALVNVIAGNDAKILNGSEDGTNGSFEVTQAFLQYATGGLTIIAGKYVTMAGAEVIAPVGNTSFSRSLLFTNLEPLTHTGVRGTYAVNDMFSFTVGVNNGWNVTTDNNSNKTVEAGFTLAPIPALSFAVTGYFGNENNPGSPVGSTNLIDVVATWKVSDALNFVLNYDNKSVKDVPTVGTVKSDGFALYGNWTINDMWRLSVRLEQIKDDDNGGVVTGLANEKVKEATITLALTPTKSTEFRLEVRQDKSSGDTAVADKLFTNFGGGATDAQTEIALQGLYKF